MRIRPLALLPLFVLIGLSCQPFEDPGDGPPKERAPDQTSADPQKQPPVPPAPPIEVPPLDSGAGQGTGREDHLARVRPPEGKKVSGPRVRTPFSSGKKDPDTFFVPEIHEPGPRVPRRTTSKLS